MPAGDSSSSSGPAGVEAVWASLTTEPNTGVSIVDAEGRILYLNAQAAAIFLGDRLKTEDALGRDLGEVLSPAFAVERLAAIRRVIDSGRPILFRAIWKGFQHFSWIHPLHDRDDDGASIGRVLVITRRLGGGEAEPLVGGQDIERVDAEVIDLGQLEVLTPRELVVMALLGAGMSVKEAAGRLHRSVKTVETHRENIGRKLQVRDRAELITLARHAGLTVTDAERRQV